MNDLEIKKALLTCPGDTIQEHIDTIGMSQAELAERLGKAPGKLNEIIKGGTPITHETAKKLEYVLDVPAYFWLNLERRYQDELNEIKKLEELEKFKDWLIKFPTSSLKKWDIIPNKKNVKEHIVHLLKFFRVASPEEWERIYNEQSVAFKLSLKPTKKTEPISVWLRLGELQAENLELKKYDKNLLKKNLSKFKEISYEAPTDWMQQLQKQCSEMGIALVYTPKIKHAPIVGTARWIRNYKIPLIQMSDRNKSYNSFWFGFFHELGHIILHGKKDVFLEGIENIQEDTDKEKEADNFAQNHLLGPKFLKDIKYYANPDSSMIEKISKEHKIHESIIVAQIQRQDDKLYRNKRLNMIKNTIKVEIAENEPEILKKQISIINQILLKQHIN